MTEHLHIHHHIQKHILSVLMQHKYARFRDMRPERVDTNLYSYHLKLLLKNDMVNKTEHGYTLGLAGILYSERHSSSGSARVQPKIVTMTVIQNRDGEILLYRRARQPFADRWSLLFGKLHIEDLSIEAAARREAREKLGVDLQNLRRAGDCYIRLHHEYQILISTLAHVFYAVVDDVATDERLKWVSLRRLLEYKLSPAVDKIIARTFFGDEYFFEEYHEEMSL